MERRSLSDAAVNVAAGFTNSLHLYLVNIDVLIEAEQLIIHGLHQGIWLKSEKPEVRRRLELIREAMPDALARSYDILQEEVKRGAARDAA